MFPHGGNRGNQYTGGKLEQSELGKINISCDESANARKIARNPEVVKEGIWLDEMFPSKGNEYSACVTMREANINKNESANARKIARNPEVVKEGIWLDEMFPSNKSSNQYLLATREAGSEVDEFNNLADIKITFNESANTRNIKLLFFPKLEIDKCY